MPSPKAISCENLQINSKLPLTNYFQGVCAALRSALPIPDCFDPEAGLLLNRLNAGSVNLPLLTGDCPFSSLSVTARLLSLLNTEHILSVYFVSAVINGPFYRNGNG